MGKYIVLLFSLVFLASCTGVVTNPTKSPNPNQNASGTTVGALIDAPTFGSGAHRIEYYSDFQCPACIRFSHVFLPILEEFAASGKTTIVYKQFPLTTIHKNAYRDSLAFYCAVEQGKSVMDYKKALYALEEKKSGASVSDDDRIAAIEGLELDKDAFTQCLSQDKYTASVDRDMAEGDAKRVNATPTVILDGTKLDFSIFRDEGDFRTQMERILSK